MPPRTIADMTNEMEGVLTELPKYTAYAKILQGKEMWKGRIKTHPLPDKTYTYGPGNLMFLINGFCEDKAKIEVEIRKRQEKWRPKPEIEEETKKPVEEPGKPKKDEKAKKRWPPPTFY